MEQRITAVVVEEMRKIGRDLLCWRKTEDLKNYTYKKGKEVVSELDRRAEAKAKEIIRRLLPDYKIWGEELGRDSGNLIKENFILIDTIDGSKNYLADSPLFASQIAAFECGMPAWSIVNLPALDEMYLAIRGRGAFCNDKLLRPSSQDRLDLALQCFGIGHTAENFLRLPTIIRSQLAEPRHYGSAGVHWSFLACGRTDIYIAAEAAYYDAAPGILLCKEAKLEFCCLDGSLYIEGENDLSVVAGNAELIRQYKEVVHG